MGNSPALLNIWNYEQLTLHLKHFEVCTASPLAVFFITYGTMHKCVCTHVHSFTTTLMPEVSLISTQRESMASPLNMLTVLRGYLGLALIYRLHVDVWQQRASECAPV